MKKSDLITEGIKEKIKQEPFDPNEEAKPKRSKWIKWVLNFFDTIATFFT